MSASQRRKGQNGEREIVNLAKAAGLDAERTWGTAFSCDPVQRACDVTLNGRPYQVKRRAQAYGELYAALAHVDGAFIRADGREWLAVMRLSDWLKRQTENTKA